MSQGLEVQYMTAKSFACHYCCLIVIDDEIILSVVKFFNNFQLLIFILNK